MDNRVRAVETALRQISSLFRHDRNVFTKSFLPAKRHRVYLSFVRQANGWHCRFHQDNLGRTPISKRFVFRNSEKLVEVSRRGRGLTGAGSDQSLNEAVACGHGQILLMLDDKQYEALSRKS